MYQSASKKLLQASLEDPPIIVDENETLVRIDEVYLLDLAPEVGADVTLSDHKGRGPL